MATATFGERLREALKSSGLTAYEAARRSGLSRASLSRYLRGQRRPTHEAVVKLARTLGLTVEAFCG